MIRKMVGEVTGLSDVGKIVDKAEYDMVQADDYIFHEDNEIIHYVIKSLKDEYCFTNLGIIHVDGDSAMSTKRLVKRYTYKHYTVGKVLIESAGNLDRDCEIKFSLKDEEGQLTHMSIDVDKNQIERLKDMYKALTSIGNIQKDAAVRYQKQMQAIDATVSIFSGARTPEVNINNMEEVLSLIEARKIDAYTEYKISDFGSVFMKYIEN